MYAIIRMLLAEKRYDLIFAVSYHLLATKDQDAIDVLLYAVPHIPRIAWEDLIMDLNGRPQHIAEFWQSHAMYWVAKSILNEKAKADYSWQDDECRYMADEPPFSCCNPLCRTTLHADRPWCGHGNGRHVADCVICTSHLINEWKERRAAQTCNHCGELTDGTCSETEVICNQCYDELVNCVDCGELTVGPQCLQCEMKTVDGCTCEEGAARLTACNACLADQ